MTRTGRYCYIPVTYKVTLGRIVDLLLQFKRQSQTLLMPSMPGRFFRKKALFSVFNIFASR